MRAVHVWMRTKEDGYKERRKQANKTMKKWSRLLEREREREIKKKRTIKILIINVK
jgi:hypothetical protein